MRNFYFLFYCNFALEGMRIFYRKYKIKENKIRKTPSLVDIIKNDLHVCEFPDGSRDD